MKRKKSADKEKEKENIKSIDKCSSDTINVLTFFVCLAFGFLVLFLLLLWPFYYFICLMRLFVVDHYMNNSLVRIEFMVFTKVKSSLLSLSGGGR